MRITRARAFGLAASTVLVAAVAGFGSLAHAATDPQARFIAKCTFSHRLSDDPIVKPRMPGASHSHDFFGNTTTDAFSTVTKMNRGGTTCVNALDKSGYWVPSLTVDGTTVDPTFTNVYYQAAGKPYATIKTIPRGLKVVAGDAMATTPQSIKIVSWNCGNDDDTPTAATPPTCPEPTLTVHINFPDCWNHKTLDSPDHKSHLAYHLASGACPAGYPVPIPRVRVNVHYPTTGGPGVALASGGQYSGHADFFNVWNPTELKRLITTCINAGIACNAKA